MVQIDLGERLIRLADKVLSKNSNETIGHTGGITNATANDTYIPTTKAVKEYVDDKFNNVDYLTGSEVVSSWEQTLSDEKVPSEKLVKEYIDNLPGNEVVTSWEQTLSNKKVPSERLVKEYVDDLIGNVMQYIQQ